MSPERQLDFARAILNNPDATDHAKLKACRTIIDTTDPDTLEHARALDLKRLIESEVAA